jgi:hypothetical protein
VHRTAVLHATKWYPNRGVDYACNTASPSDPRGWRLPGLRPRSPGGFPRAATGPHGKRNHAPDVGRGSEPAVERGPAQRSAAEWRSAEGRPAQLDLGGSVQGKLVQMERRGIATDRGDALRGLAGTVGQFLTLSY